jgi:hypothetical protein
MITFCDDEEPQVKTALEAKDSPFASVKESIKEPWYLKFNNSALYK